MGTTGSPDLEALQTVTMNLASSVASIEPDQWNSATPCSEWDLTALVDHITGGNWFTIAILTGQLADDALAATMERFSGASATSDAAIQSLNVQAAAFHQPEALDRTWSHVAGDLTGGQILRLRVHDLIVHSWDVEQALRSGAGLPDHLVRWGRDELVNDDSLTALHFSLDASSGGSLDNGETAYLAAFGR
ncbi:MAG: TIGR03086 family metal-binding protein [Microthrixaceae bacterium]|nr:TIGR03086 family protein [Microthrixaceae bacterium]MCB1013040.1 TIGR03086 family protein [Microthrixaceae bacterium]MCO5322603.1 TIGR03086 family metal-binding protein [Microthrixaceae bacterium]